MITKIRKGFKMATVRRKRLVHKERLLLQKVEETRYRIDVLMREEKRKQTEFYKRLNLIEL